MGKKVPIKNSAFNFGANKHLQMKAHMFMKAP